MALRINNSYFRVNNGSFVSREPSITFSMGEVYRVVNTGGTTDSLSYTKINGSTTSTGDITSGAIAYILAVSGSLSDATLVGSLNQLTVTRLLITSSVDYTPTFTEALITTTGAGTWTKPEGVTEVIVECWGGGGAGGGATNNPAVGGGGGGGQYSRKYIQYTSPSVGISYSIAAAVTGTTTTVVNGQDTSWNTTTVIAKGGTGGGVNGDPAVGISGGLGNQAGSVGDVIRFGQDGVAGSQDRALNPLGGPGGVGAGSVEISFNVGTELGGSGGTVAVGSQAGLPGSNYGGGGGGAATNVATNRAGGNGAQGLIRLIYR